MIVTEYDEIVTHIRSDDIRAYLAHHNWESASRDHADEVYVKATAAGNRLQVFVPNDGDQDYRLRRIADTLRTISAFERRPSSDVARDIVHVREDVILCRLPGAVQSGISLDLATRLVKGMEELLVYGASNEIEEPRPVIGRRTKVAQSYIEKCTLGHTRPGSFIFEFTSPINEPETGTLFPSAATPFGRRVVERVVKGLLDVSVASVSADPQRIVDGFHTGFNANQCDALATILEDDGSAFQFSVNWSPEIPASPDLVTHDFIEISPRSRDVLRRASGALRNVSPRTDRTVTGRISRLGDAADGTPRTIVLIAVVDGYEKRISMTLAPNDYSLACDAHRDGRRVQVTGRIEKDGRKLLLHESSDFRVL